MTDMLKAAHWWAGKGFAVFPLRSQQKTPATSKGFKDATTADDALQAWFVPDSRYNLGLATGAGLLVIDIDRKNGVDGLVGLQDLESQLGALPKTLKVTTPSGGIHLYFSYDKKADVRNSAGKLAAGVDIRANGGYVAAPPSKLDNGAYEIAENAAIAALPDKWLAHLRHKPKPKPDTTKPTEPRPDQAGQGDQVSELQAALNYIDPAPYDTWVKVGMALYKLADQGFVLWDNWSRGAANYDQAALQKKWPTFASSDVQPESVFYMAAENGWQNPRKGKRPEQAESKPNAGESPAGISGLIEQALAQAEQGDLESMQNEAIVNAFRQVRAVDELAYQRYRSQVQQLKHKPFALGFLDKQTKPPKEPRYTEKEDGDNGGAPRQGKADLFIEMVRKWADVFCDDSGTPYASFMVEPIDRDTGEVLTEQAHVETWRMFSEKFQSKAGREFYRRFGTVVGESAMKEALTVLAAEADERSAQPVYLRYAMLNDAVYVDLCDEAWQVVEITATDWRILSAVECPVKFRRVKYAEALPLPERGGDIGMLWQHVNVVSPDARLLALAWLIDAMLIQTDYTVLEIIAGQGSAKSTTQECFKLLLDPNKSNLRKAPDSIRDLSISAGSNHVISLNNMSHLSGNEQDFLCSMSTGGGDAARKLYTTDDEAVWDIKRPVVMNGINQLVTRPDLADRTVCLELQKIEGYTAKANLQAAWDSDYAKLLGALYSLVSGVLQELPKVELAKSARMADFVKLGTAMVKTLGLDVDFVEVFQRNRDEVVRRGVEASPVALALLDRIRAYGAYEGSAKDLLNALEEFQPKYYDKAAWPKSPRGLGEMLRRLAPALQVYHVDVDKVGRDYRITKIDPKTDTVETTI